MTSISVTDANKIYFLENGLIQSEEKTRAEIIHTLSGEYFSKPVYYSLCLSYKTIILIDGEDDWIIFLELCKRLDLNISIFKKDLLIVKCSSTSNKKNSLEDLAGNKIDWVIDFVHNVKNIEYSESIKLKNVILICDRDDYTDDKTDFTPQKVCPASADKDYFQKIKFKTHYGRNKDYPIKTKGFIWNRRCIENYLISKNARCKNKFEITDDLKAQWKIDKIHFTDNEMERLPEYYIGLNNEKEPKFLDDDKERLNDRVLSIINCKGPIRSCINHDPQGINSGLDKEKLKDYIKSMDYSDLDPKIREYYNELKNLIIS